MKKSKIMGILLSGILAVSMCSCSGMNDENGFASDVDRFFGQFGSSDDVSYKEPPKIEVSDYYTTPYDNPFERNLTDNEIEIYNLFCYYIEHYELEFDFYDSDEDEVIKVYKAVIDDHPEYFWLTKGYSYTKNILGNNVSINFKPTLYGGSEGIKEKEAELKSKVRQIVSEAKKKENLYEKVKFVHDFIIDNTTYDIEAMSSYVDYNELNAEDPYFDSSTAYGCLVKGKAVCSGYSAAFQCIMKELEIPCGRVSGKAVKGGEAHQWNYLRLGDYNYHIDVTWDDPLISSDDANYNYERKTYNYFLVTTNEIEMTHIISEDQDIPECNGLEYNYYIYNNLYLEKYDFDYVSYIIREHLLSENVVAIKFSSEEELLKACDDLIENSRIFDIQGIGSHVSYTQDEDNLIFTVYNN